MKNLLITGNVASLAAHLCQRLSRQYHMVVAALKAPPIALGKGVEVLLLSEQKTLEHVFQEHSFQGMIFLATRGEQHTRVPGEVDYLSSALALAKRHGVDKVLFLSSGELSRQSEASSERGVLLQAMEQLCLTYRQQGVDAAIVRLPCVFGPGETDTLIGRMLLAAARGETAVLPFSRDAQIDFISAAEVAQLAYRLMERTGRPDELLMVRGAEALTVRELTALFGLLGASVSQGTGEVGYPPMGGIDFQRSYGFTPSERLSVVLDSLYTAVRDALHKQEAQRGRIRSFLSRHPALIKGTSLLAGYGAMEALQMLQDAGQFPAADLRLLYVALVGAAHGLQTGLLAVVFASFSIARVYGAQSVDIYALLSDWKTWVPFGIMILAGSFTGFARDRSRREARSAAETASILEKRCSFLQDLYKQSLLSKEESANQAGEKHEGLEQQLAQLRKGQERLEQEWLTLLKREQNRWGMDGADEGNAKEETLYEQLRAEEAARQENFRLEQQAEQVRLQRVLLSRMQAEEMNRLEQAVMEKRQLLKTQLEGNSLPMQPGSLHDEPVPEDEVKDMNGEDQSSDDLPSSFGEEPEEQDSQKVSTVMDSQKKNMEPAKPYTVSLPEDKDRVLLSGSPFGKMSPAERRRMLEAMQVHSKRKPASKRQR